MIKLGKLKIKKLMFKKSVVVVEIGNDWLKIIESSFTSKGMTITKVNLLKLAQIEGPTALAISKIFSDLKLNKKFVITYIPRHLITVRVLELPSVEPEEIKEIIDLQIGKQTPYSKEEIISSYKIIGSERGGYSKVILVIVRRNLIKTRLEELGNAGVNVVKFAVSSEGVYNWFRNAYQNELWFESQTNVVLDIDSNYSDFIIIRKGKLVFSRSILIGANHLIEEPDEWRNKFVEEIRRSIELYQNEESGHKISKIFLSGAISELKNLEGSFSSDLDVLVEVSDPLKNINIAMNRNFIEEHELNRVSLSSLFGIAIARKKLSFDLIPPGLKIQKQVEKKRKQLTVMGGLFIAVITMISFLFLTVIYNKGLHLKMLKERIASFEKGANEVEGMRAKINLIEERFNAKGTPLNMLYEIYRLTPKEVYLTSLRIEENKQVALKGLAFSMSDVYKYNTTLKTSLVFAGGAETTYAKQVKEDGVEYTKFEIICFYGKKGQQ
ncbi:MAG: pilus assembly protein PilM [Candidatus Omnitrophica bacterium]|nr:pilus assembly protein PilM [Candidatus Omnitrophota bacterium]